MFVDSSNVLDEYHKDRQVIAVREKYANIMFLKESTIYILFLLILTTGNIFPPKFVRISKIIFSWCSLYHKQYYSFL